MSLFAVHHSVPRARRRRSATRLFAAPVAFCLFVGCGAPKSEPATATTSEPAVVPVTVTPMTAVQLPRTVTATGTLHAADDVMLTPKVDGKVIAVHADLGDRLAPGAPLLDLDPTDYQLAVLEARRALDAELARLGLTELPDKFDEEAVPTVLVAEVSRKNADRKYRLWKESNTSSQAEMLAAELDLRAAEANKKVAVATALAALAAAKLRKATLDTAEQRLRDTKLRVPDAAPGTTSAVQYAVAQRLTSVGEMIRAFPSTNVYRLVNDATLKLRVALPEQHIPDVTVGQTAAVSTLAYPTPFAGRVSRINPTVDTTTRTFQVEIEVPNGNGKLKAGGFARATINVRTDTATAIPNSALVTFAGVNKVFFADGGKAKAVLVTVGLREKEWTEVNGDLPAGANVITSGFSQLYDGCPIRIRKP